MKETEVNDYDPPKYWCPECGGAMYFSHVASRHLIDGYYVYKHAYDCYSSDCSYQYITVKERVGRCAIDFEYDQARKARNK